MHVDLTHHRTASHQVPSKLVCQLGVDGAYSYAGGGEGHQGLERKPGHGVCNRPCRPDNSHRWRQRYRDDSGQKTEAQLNASAGWRQQHERHRQIRGDTGHESGDLHHAGGQAARAEVLHAHGGCKG